ncbi:hypothetical protein JTB14_023376 [Gonioctena quinquepunctata]|nr:hypothetical protein JTB14_023376 [Gonioctena quinquepunctata]
MALTLLIKRTNHILPRNTANFGIFTKKVDYKVCFQILGIEETSDQEQIRAAYLGLVKKYHPDSGTDEANAEKFQEIDKAFRNLINRNAKERWDVEEGDIVNHPDIKHTAPQHRQYLSYDGLAQEIHFRDKNNIPKFEQCKLLKMIFESWEKVPLKHKIKTKYGFDRLVEDLIQESISKGDFNNLKNSGKPLPSYQNRNPYVDFVTHKINEVLIENGFTPEWITLQKEIREEIKQLRKDLLLERKHFGPYPLSVEENIVWSEKVYQYKKIAENINKKITKFNLVVPVLNKQMLHVFLESEIQKALINGKSGEVISNFTEERIREGNSSDTTVNLFSMIDNLFKGK